MYRDDLSDKLIHLTKGTWSQAADMFRKILDQKKLLGGTGGIQDEIKCICFSEAPISKLAHILAYGDRVNFRYAPFGVMVDKRWLFEKGGRPVIYQREEEYKLLHADQAYRHKRYEPDDPNVDDLSWEREWRIQTDELPLELEHTTIVVPNRKWEQKVLEPLFQRIQSFALLGVILPKPRQKDRWHIIVLEDLGVLLQQHE